MADTNQNLDDFDGMLKDYYEGPWKEHVHKKVTAYKIFTKSKRKWTGRRVVMGINLRRTPGIGARGAEGSLPKAGRQRYEDALITAKFQYARVSVTGPVIEASRNDRGAFASAMKTEIRGARRDMVNDLDRQCFGNRQDTTGAGKFPTGILGKISAGGGTTTLTISNGDINNFDEGMSIVAGTDTELTNGTPLVVLVVQSVDHANDQIEVDAATGANADWLVRGDSLDNSYNNEWTGLEWMISDDDTLTFQGIDPSVFARWLSSVIDNGGAGNRPLSLELMQEPVTTLDVKSGDYPDCIVTKPETRDEYVALLHPDVRYQARSLKGGFTGELTYAGGDEPIPIKTSRKCTSNAMFYLCSGDINVYEQMPLRWQKRDGRILRQTTDKDEWQAFMATYSELGLESRFNQAKLTEIQVGTDVGALP